MSTSIELQARLEAFRAAGRNLQLDPLTTQKELAQFGVPYQLEMLDEIEEALEDAIDGDTKLIFTGHRGCGKSTLLAELGNHLWETGQFFVVSFSISDTIERSAVDHVNILFSIALQLLEVAERRSVKLPPGTKLALYRWLGKHTQTESKSLESEIEASASAGGKGGFPGLLKFLAEIKAKMKVNSVIRQEMSVEFARKISDLIEKLNEIRAYIENATKQKIVVIIDDLDKLDLSVTEVIFSKNIKSLLAPDFRIVYTVSIATLRELAVKESIAGSFKKIYTMRVAKFFPKNQVRNVDRVPDAKMMELFKEILAKRLSPDLIEAGIETELILKSGGVLRELIRITDLCCDKCKLMLRRQMRAGDEGQAVVKIDGAVLGEVLTDLQIGFAEPLGRQDYQLLKFIYAESEPENSEDQRFLNLLHNLYVLEYRNASQWYDLNPIVIDLLRQRGDLA